MADFKKLLLRYGQKAVDALGRDGLALVAVWALLGLLTLARGASFLFFLCLCLWTYGIVYCLRDLGQRYAFFIFLLAFFLFLLGGEITDQYFGCKLEYTFDPSTDAHAFLAILISLAALILGAQLGDLGKKEKKEPRQTLLNRNRSPERVRHYALLLGMGGLYASFLPYLISQLEAAIFVLQNGYLKYYTEFSSQLPKVLSLPSELFPMFFFMYLAAMPKKKQCLVPFLLYFGCGCIGLLTGRRLNFGIAILVLVAYIIMRHFRDRSEGWIRKKWLLIALGALPVLVVALYCYRFLRYQEEIQGGNIFDIFIRFFNQQGVSITTLKFQKRFEGDPLGCTSLYYTLKYLRCNSITEGLLNFPVELYEIRGQATALKTNSLADFIMFRVSKVQYLKGYGLGTSYVAELYHDLGYVGVGLGSLLYGFAMNRLFRVDGENRSPWRLMLGFMVLEEFVILPRYSADVVLRPFLSISKNAVLLCCIFAVEYLSRHRKEEKRK